MIVSIPFNKKHLMFQYRDTLRPYGETKKNFDLQVIKEIFEENVYQLTEDKLNGAKVVVDIGGHLGAFSLMATAMGATKVYAFEPNNDNVQLLNTNREMNNFENIIEIIPKAVYPTNTPIRMDNFYSDSRVEELSDLASKESKVSVDDSGSFTASTVNLEDFLEDVPEVDFCKVDVEWSEFKIIPALSDEFMRKIKFMAIEFHGVDSSTFGNLVSHLTRCYRLDILGSHERGGFLWCRRY